MAIDSTHPDYDLFLPDFVLMRDMYDGERAVKDKGTVYLPATQGMQLDGMEVGQPGRKAYDAYKLRAVFHEFVKEAVELAIGKMHDKPATIELPPQMQPLIERATPQGESLQLLLRRINEEQLVSGRAGLLADLPAASENPLPFIALYAAEAIRNWDANGDELSLVVLDESGFEREGFEWVTKTRYRVLDVAGGQYRAGVFTDNTFNDLEMIPPLFRGRALQRIPFVFANAKDITAEPDEPPWIGLGRLALAVYRGEADYRQNLFMQGQDTLVVIGATRQDDGRPLRTGAGGGIEVEVGGDAKYVGVSSQGLAEQRLALEADKKAAEARAGHLSAGSSTGPESGIALSIRVAAQTASLRQIAMAGAAALEQSLRSIAEWMGANPDAVVVEPSTDFADSQLTGRDLLEFAQANAMGAPISKRSIHAIAFERGLTTMTFEEEMDQLEEESAGNFAPIGDGGG